MLMNALIDAARAHGLSVMEGTVLAENKAMLQLMKELGLSRDRVADEASVVLVQRQL